MRTLALLAVTLPPLFAAAAACAAPAAAATTQIYQQRTSDGRLLLTDRPDPLALTERSWAMPAEDPAAARQRALDVQLQAAAVSERVQRRLAEQERLAAADAQRRNVQAYPGRGTGYGSGDDAGYGYGYGYGYSYGDGDYGVPVIVAAPPPYLRGRSLWPNHEHGHRRPDGRPVPSRQLRGSAAPESR